MKATATSVAKWTHKRITESDFEYFVARTHTSEIQAHRGRLGGQANGKTRREQGIELLTAGKTIDEVVAITGASQKNRIQLAEQIEVNRGNPRPDQGTPSGLLSDIGFLQFLWNDKTKAEILFTNIL